MAFRARLHSDSSTTQKDWALMDIRKDGWFGRLTINGKTILLDDSKNIMSQGSLMRIVGDALKSLTSERARSGDCTIQLTIGNAPLTENKLTDINRVNEVQNELTGEVDLPLEDEEYGEFYDRLIEGGYTPAAAEMVAGEWFNVPPNPRTGLWLNDSKAIRFRELNSRDEAYESALPQEYEQLKQYVREQYAEFVEHLTFRTAG
jgi:hypothetical protein